MISWYVSRQATEDIDGDLERPVPGFASDPDQNLKLNGQVDQVNPIGGIREISPERAFIIEVALREADAAKIINQLVSE